MALTNEASSNEADVGPGGAALTGGKKNRSGRKGRPETMRSVEIAGSRPKAAPSDKPTPRVKPVQVQAAAGTKTTIVLQKLKSLKGVTIEALMEATGWQTHSVRGFLSAVVRKKLGLNLVSETGKDGVRRYRIDDAATRAK